MNLASGSGPEIICSGLQYMIFSGLQQEIFEGSGSSFRYSKMYVFPPAPVIFKWRTKDTRICGKSGGEEREEGRLKSRS